MIWRRCVEVLVALSAVVAILSGIGLGIGATREAVVQYQHATQPIIVQVPSPPPSPAVRGPLRRLLPARDEPAESTVVAGAARGVTGGPRSPDGSESVMVDILPQLRKRNTGGMGPRGPGTGAGLCVFTSIMHAALDQNERRLWGLQDYMKSKPGGGWPQKVDEVMKAFAPGVAYIQDTESNFDLLKAALKSGRSPGVTYDGRYAPVEHYGGKRISHMVNLVHLSDKWAAILDNNYVGDDQLIWMTPQQFVETWKGTSGAGWQVILLAPAAAPMLHN